MHKKTPYNSYGVSLIYNIAKIIKLSINNAVYIHKIRCISYSPSTSFIDSKQVCTAKFISSSVIVSGGLK